LYHCRDKEYIYLITKYYERKSLHHLFYLEKTTLTKQLYYLLLKDIVEGLIYLHNNGNQPILHLDLKPKNILIDGVGEPRAIIADFGLSRIQNQTKLSLKKGTPGGTYPYMSPEIVQGAPSSKSDIYSMGIIMWEMAHKEIPYCKLSSINILDKVKEGLRPQWNPSFPVKLKEISELCWMTDPSGRPDANQLLTLVEEIPFERDNFSF